jgi:formylglycine-generating enzyme required for sulfatase activity/predicted Ser/Thr protein kinase
MNPDDMNTHPADAERDIDSLPSCDSEANALLRAIAHAPPRRPANLIVPGTKWGEVDRYTIDRRIGRGGMGTVYAATDTVLERTVALKVLDAARVGQDAGYKKQLLREAKLAARVEHERIARVYDVGNHDGYGFVAMEYVDGETLRTWMAGRPATASEIIEIAIEIAEGLAALHAKAVVHRDLKPENVMRTRAEHIKLLDFGLARTALAAPDAGLASPPTAVDSASLTAASGTPGYMAPEQCAGQPIDARADVFALGVIINELVTGERLFHGDTAVAIIQATLAWVPELRNLRWQNVPDRLRVHTQRMLAHDPSRRFEDGASVLAALAELRGEPSWRSVELPDAIQMGKAATQRALPAARRPGISRRLDRKGVVIACGATTAIFAGIWAITPPAVAPAPPPPDMAMIDVGAITVGTTDAEIERECTQIGLGCDREHMRREPPHEVTVPPFFLDRHEVTNEQFVDVLNRHGNALFVAKDSEDQVPRFVRRTGSERSLLDLRGPYVGIQRTASGYRVLPGHEHLPVIEVSWYGARWYCETENKRLPTDDEWEAAARGHDHRRFPWGNDLPRWGEVALSDDGSLRPVSPSPVVLDGARPVGSSRQDVTPDGVFDLAGNVAEWTASSASPERSTPPTSPELAVALRFVRGGSWAASIMARSDGRLRRDVLTMGTNYGFRCAASAADQ